MILTRKIITSLFSTKRNYQVTVVGGASDIGQSLCLLLKTQPGAISKLVFHDCLEQASGVILDLQHVPSDLQFEGYSSANTLPAALEGSNIVIGAGGLILKPGITEKLWYDTNKTFIKSLATQVAKVQPMPLFGILTEPINKLVPMAAEVMRMHGDYDPKKLFGISGVDVLRARALYLKEYMVDPYSVYIPVIGGRSDLTALPLLSQGKPAPTLDKKAFDATLPQFMRKFRKTDEILMKAKRGHSPTLSVAYSAFQFTHSLVDALNGRPAQVQAFIENNDFGTSFFGGLIHLNHDGVIEMQRYTDLAENECTLLEKCIDQIRSDVIQGKRALEVA